MSEHRGRVGTEPSHKRVRIAFGGELIVDTDDALDVWEIHYYPQYYVPLGDVADGVLQPSTTRSPSRGTADHYTVRTSHRDAPDAAWRYPDTPIEAPRERVRFDWGAMDAWFEEDEEIFVHPRDPSTRVQILLAPRHDRRRRRRGRRPDPAHVAVRDPPAAAHVHPQARRPHGPARADVQRLDVPVQGHGALLVARDTGRRAHPTSCGATRSRSASRQRSPA